MGFVVIIILGIGALAAAGIGVGGVFHAKALHSLSQLHSIVITVIGGGIGIPCWVIGSVGLVRSGSCREAKLQNNEKATLQPPKTSEAIGTSKAQEILQPPQKEPDKAEEQWESPEQNETEQSVIRFDVQASSGYSGAEPLIARLALDNLANIFQYLTLKELTSAIRVCKYWYGIGVSDRIWKRLFEIQFGQINPQLNTRYKLEYDKKFFEKPQEFLRCGADIQNVYFDLNANAIITYNNTSSICSIWSPVTGKCLKILPNDPKHYGHSVAIENQTIARIQNSKVFVSNIQDRQETFQYVHQAAHVITIRKDIVVTLGGRNMKVWCCKNSKILWELPADSLSNTPVIHNDCLAYVDMNRKQVTVFSLKTGKQLHTISAQHVEVYRNWIVCGDDNTFSIYSLETGQCLRNFPQQLPMFREIIIHNEVLICLDSKEILEQNSILATKYSSTITTYSLVTGDLLQQFILDGFANMMMSRDDLLVCCNKSQEIAKVWKLSQKK